MIVTIDGPAGSGKSSTARAVARRMGFVHLDSGALYRAFAYVALRDGLVWRDEPVTAAAARALSEAAVEAELDAGRLVIRADGTALRAELRSPEVTEMASRISGFAPIRERVNEWLRRLANAHPGGIVCEGRDMGTVVFPEADLKVFMTASVTVRARRRLEQQGEEPTTARIEAEAARLAARDRSDSERDVSPLRQPPDATVIDTTRLSFEDQVNRIVEMARKRLT